MNIKRGLFRLWLALSLLWVLGVGAMGYDQIAKDTYFKPPFKLPEGFISLVPMLCGQARGEAGKDYTTKENQKPGPWDAYAKPNPFDECWYELPAFRRLWPEYNDMKDDALEAKLYEMAGHPLTIIDPLAASKRVALFAFIPPIALLLLGSLFVWVIVGFGRPKTS